MTLQFDLLETLGLSALVVGAGHLLRKIVPWLEQMNFPAPVVGGITTSVALVLFKHFDLITFKFDTTLQLPLMMGFFASIGFAASVRSLKSGGKLVFLFLFSQ
jgi:ESS family glutamate:Na+ symporter